MLDKERVAQKTINFEKLEIIIRRVMQTEKKITFNSNLELDLGFDSIAKINLLLEVEKELKIKLPDSFMSEIVCVKDIIEKIEKLTFKETTDYENVRNIEDLILQPPELSDLRQINQRNKKLNLLKECLVYFWVKFLTKVCFFIDITGMELIENKRDPFILAPNHSSYLDGLLILSVVPFKIKRKLFFIGLSDLFERTSLKHLKEAVGILPFDECSQPLRALKAGIYAMKEGYSICIFPEGNRSYDGKIGEFKKGIAFLTKHTQVPVYPVYIKGTFESWPRFRKWPRLFKKIYIKVGKPIFWYSKKDIKEDDFLNSLRDNLINLSKEVEKKKIL